MRFTSLVLAAACIAATGTVAHADTMMKASPKPSPSAMHSKAMHTNAMHSSAMHGHMMATPKPKAKPTSRP